MGLEDDKGYCCEGVDVETHMGEEDDMLENSYERPHLDEDEVYEDDEGEEEDMFETSGERTMMGDDGEMLPHLGEDSYLLENMVRRPHLGEDGELLRNMGGRELVEYERGDENVEPGEGMEFESEEAAKMFYNSYARRMGFSIRVSIYCRSKRDGSIISRRFVCSKEGFRRNRNASNEGRSKRPRAITREGCKAMIVVKKQSSGKWFLSKFERDHSHPLAPPGKVHCLRSHRGDKDKTIRELTQELDRVNRKCAWYREHLLMVLKDVDQHLSKKVEDIRQTIREIESEDQVQSLL
ncbi:uncharacterized protein LOC143856703 [Tasmannia lanceolata]|uniref:uncharacterized protein LOC143856703 n=1 Tax=Tasmannia lanceolata TaxID=3420 RepID=UPI004063110F